MLFSEKLLSLGVGAALVAARCAGYDICSYQWGSHVGADLCVCPPCNNN